jgi:hypothetical protein
VGIRGRLRKVESAAEEKMIVIPQRDGTVRRFPAEEGMKAYMNLMNRLGAGAPADSSGQELLRAGVGTLVFRR